MRIRDGGIIGGNMLTHLYATLAFLASRTRQGAITASQTAQSMVEYSIIAALVAIVALAAVSNLGQQIAGVFGRLASSVAGLGA
jgi:Flp pilus assembly pilin Flp